MSSSRAVAVSVDSETSQYAVHPDVATMARIVANLKTRTGRDIDQWITLVQEAGPDDERERIGWLKRDHCLGTYYAKIISDLVSGRGVERCDPDAYLQAARRWVEVMFPRVSSEMRQVYERLLGMARNLGGEVKVAPCRTSVQLFRRHLFAQIRPCNQCRVDLGLALRGSRGPRRLADTGGLERGERITHRIAIRSLAEIDAEVRHWLRVAYEADR